MHNSNAKSNAALTLLEKVTRYCNALLPSTDYIMLHFCTTCILGCVFAPSTEWWLLSCQICGWYIQTKWQLKYHYIAQLVWTGNTSTLHLTWNWNTSTEIHSSEITAACPENHDNLAKLKNPPGRPAILYWPWSYCLQWNTYQFRNFNSVWGMAGWPIKYVTAQNTTKWKKTFNGEMEAYERDKQ